MKEIKFCDKCEAKHTTYYCDECGEKIVGMAVEVNFSYPSERDGDAWHFCSDECFCTYLTEITEE